LFVVLLIPLQMIGGLVAERQGRQQQVVQEVAASSYGRQVFAGPLLTLPYIEEYDETITEEKRDKTVTRIERRRVAHRAVFFPASTDIAATGQRGKRSRADCSRRACSTGRRERAGEFVFDGKFAFARAHQGSRLTPGKPFVSVAIGDPRGLSAATVLHWNGKPVALERGTNLDAIDGGVHAPVFRFRSNEAREPGVRAGLRPAWKRIDGGGAALGNTTVRLASDWPHPSFGGRFLPLPQTTVGPGGFEASWSVKRARHGGPGAAPRCDPLESGVPRGELRGEPASALHRADRHLLALPTAPSSTAFFSSASPSARSSPSRS